MQYGKNNLRNFYMPIAISDSLKPKWDVSTHGSYNNSSVIVYNKYVITHDLSGNIYFFDLDIGAELGTLKYSGSINAAPIFYKSRLFFIVNDLEEKYSTAYYYDVSDGKVISQVEIEGSFTTQLLLNGTAIYAISDNGVIHKFNLAGHNDWIAETKVRVNSTPAMIDDRIIYATTDGDIVVFNTQQQKVILKKKIGSCINSGIVIAGSDVYTCDVDGNVISFNYNNGTVNWKADAKSKIMSLPVYDEKYLYVAGMSGVISCFDRFNGSLKWRTKISGAPIATPLLCKNYLIVPNLNARLYLINTSDGEVHKITKFAGRMKFSPVLFDNTLILGYDKGNIEAFEITEVK